MPAAPQVSDFGFFNYVEAAREPEQKAPTFGETLGAAFGVNNDVVGWINYLTRPVYDTDPDFDLVKRLPDDPFYERNRKAFYGTTSENEFAYREQKLRQEEKYFKTLAAAGPTGIVATLGAGVLSPASLLPLVGPGRTVAGGIASGAALGVVGAGIAETGIQAGRVTPATAEDIGVTLTAGAFLGGVLGGAVKWLGKTELEQALAEVDLASVDFQGSGGAGAQLTDVAPKTQGLKKTGIGVEKVARGTALGQVIEQKSNDTFRWMAHQLSDGGMRLEDNRAHARWENGKLYFEGGTGVARGGTVERLVNYQENAVTWQAFTRMNDLFGEYMLERTPRNVIDRVKSRYKGWQPPSGKLSRLEWKTEVSRALAQGDQHEIPTVQAAAQHLRQTVFDPILKQAQDAGLLPENVSIVGDETYLHRLYNKIVIEENRGEFVNLLANHAENKMRDNFQRQFARLQAQQQATARELEDFDLGANEAEFLAERFLIQIDELEQRVQTEFGEVQDQIDDLLAQNRELRKLENPSFADEEQIRTNNTALRELRKTEGFSDLRGKQSQFRKRVRSLSRARAVMEKKSLRLAEQIERGEQQVVNELRRAQRVGERFAPKIKQLSPAALKKEYEKWAARYNKAAGVFERHQIKSAKLAQEQVDYKVLDQMFEHGKMFDGRLNRVESSYDNMIAAESRLLDRQVLIDEIRVKQDELARAATAVLDRRFNRIRKLRERAAKLTPERLDEIRADLESKLAKRETAFLDKFTQRGADDIDLEEGTAAFRERALDYANDLTDRILGIGNRTSGMDIIQGERGAELSRVLDLPFEQIEKFIETDVEDVVQSYLRTMIPDIELQNRFGSVNGAPMKQRAREEFQRKTEEIQNNADLTDAQKSKLLKQISKEFKNSEDTIDGLISRVRHTFGLPSDPQAMSQRMGEAALLLNTTRLLGGVVLSSFPDLARSVMKEGFLRTVGDGWLPFVTGMQQAKITKREARLAGVGIEMIRDNRTRALYHGEQFVRPTTKFGKGLEFANSKMGLLTGLSKWNETLKTIDASIKIVRFVDEIEAFVSGNLGPRQTTKNMEYLAAQNLDGPAAERIWKMLQSEGGATRVNGKLLPNTDNWTDEEAKRLFRQALSGEVDNTIITPGLELPFFANKTIYGRLATQFKSFAFSSTTKTVIAGMQQSDMAFFNGMAISLALGAMSWYMKAVAAGGDILAEANEASPEKWMDEAINASGLLGVFAEITRIGERVPLVADYTKLDSSRLDRGSGSDVFELVLGPTANLGKTLFQIGTDLDDPTGSTVKRIRRTLPYQNLFYLRQLFDAAQEGVIEGTGLPERRG